MSVLHIIFALAIPAFVVSYTTPTPSTNATSPNVTCTAPEFLKINTTWTAVKLCYKSIIDHNLYGNDGPCKNVAQLKRFTNEFLGASNCLSNDTKRVNETLQMFHKLVEFAITNNTFKDFITNNGSACIEENRSQIKSCIVREDIRNLTHFNHLYWLSLDLKTKTACNEENTLRKCVNQKLKESTKKCNEKSIKFINSIFEFVMKSCPAPDSSKTGNGSYGTIYSATNVMLTALTALAFI